jgi:hypothetical protein
LWEPWCFEGLKESGVSCQRTHPLLPPAASSGKEVESNTLVSLSLSPEVSMREFLEMKVDALAAVRQLGNAYSLLF